MPAVHRRRGRDAVPRPPRLPICRPPQAAYPWHHRPRGCPDAGVHQAAAGRLPCPRSQPQCPLCRTLPYRLEIKKLARPEGRAARPGRSPTIFQQTRPGARRPLATRRGLREDGGALRESISHRARIEDALAAYAFWIDSSRLEMQFVLVHDAPSHGVLPVWEGRIL